MYITCTVCMYMYITLYLLLGDQVSYKGSLTGGYYDTRRSKLEQQRMILEMKSKLDEEENERSSLRQRLQDVMNG